MKANTQIVIFCLLSFCLTIFTVKNYLPTLIPVLGYWYTPEFDHPGADYFYANAWGQETSHSTLYHDIGRSIDSARRADVIFIGNSRMPLGLREEFIVPLAKRAGLKVFSLAVGHGESIEFARRVINRHGLRPKIIVAVGGPHMYSEWMSKLANKTISISRWQAFTHRLETDVGWFIKLHLNQKIPKVNLPTAPRDAEHMIYRSVTNGWWQAVHEPIWRYGISYLEDGTDAGENSQKHRHILPYASAFKAELDAQDSMLVSTVVPYNPTEDRHLKTLNRELGIPIIRIRLEGLLTTDGSHLSRESGESVSKEFWAKFISNPQIKQRLARP